MFEHHRKLLETILSVVEAKYADDISIIIIYGSCVNGTCHEKSDLDLIYVPKTKKGEELGRTFILDGIGYDIWCSSWAQLERFASFENMKVSVLADSELVFFASEEDKQRYEALLEAVNNIVDGNLTVDLLGKAQKHIFTAKSYLGDFLITSNLTNIGGIAMEVCDAVCLLNHAFLHFGSKRIVAEMSAMEHLPRNFISLYSSIIENPKDAQLPCAELIKATEDLYHNLKKTVPQPPEDIAGLYEEISSHWNKIRYSCGIGDAFTAFLAATSLQHTLDWVQDIMGTDEENLRFLNNYDYADLSQLAIAAEKAEAAFVKYLQDRNIPLIMYDSLDQVKQDLMG